MGKGSLPNSHPLFVGAVGLQEGDYTGAGFDQADVVICVGYDLVEYPPERWNPARDKQIVHIDPLPAEVDAAYQLAVGVQGSIAVSLDRLGERVAARAESAPRRRVLREIVDGHVADVDAGAFPLKPQAIVAAIRRVLGPDDILVSDVGAHKLWIARTYPCERVNTCIISNGFASMGIALPGAIGAKLLFPERRVLAACGDGGFLMNVQELETAVRAGTPIVTVIFEDGAYGVIKWKQLRTFGRAAYVDFGNPDFSALARSFGCWGARVERADELAAVLEEAFRQSVPAVVACPVDYAENTRLAETLGALVCPI